MDFLLYFLGLLFAAVFACGMMAARAFWRRFDRLCAEEEPPRIEFRMAASRRTHRLECSWCGYVIHGGVEPVTHGMCDRCYMEQQGELNRQFGGLNDI